MSDNIRINEASSYLRYLPALFRVEDHQSGGFLGQFLLAFEAVLTGRRQPAEPGLEELLDGIVGQDGTEVLAGVHRYFDPGPMAGPLQRAPDDFLEWLAGFVALTLRADTSPEFRRLLIARAVPLYRLRGTKQGLFEMLKLFLPVSPDDIKENDQSFQIFGEPNLSRADSNADVFRSQIGVGTRLGGGPAHSFEVTLRLPVRPDDPDTNTVRHRICALH
jgi:phage tail-like protein